METLKLRPHHVEFIRRISKINKKDVINMNKGKYDIFLILRLLQIHTLIKNPNQIVEVLPNSDIVHDSICHHCHKGKKNNNCGVHEEIFDNAMGSDKDVAAKFQLKVGEKLTVAEIMEKSPDYGQPIWRF